MLGKTNITTLSESAVVTEIEDYNWIQIQSGIFGNFVKAIYKNGYLVGITADGTIAYTTDGEAWQTHVLEYEDCKLNDIDWDGSRFIFAGSYTGTSPIEIDAGKMVQRGLIVVTSDFATYEMKYIETRESYVKEYFLIYPVNGKYIVLANDYGMHKYIGKLEGKWETEEKISGITHHYMAKNSRSIITVAYTSGYYAYIIDGSTGIGRVSYETSSQKDGLVFFECKDELYGMSLEEGRYYNLYKITNSNEFVIVSREKNFAFVDGVYFNDCKLFINNHEMLIVKKGESIADKTVDDMIEIAPEVTMNCIEKAFGQLYIFGNQGLIMKSSVETNNEEAIAVQTISAKKALFDAKKYTDERYDVLEARIAALESGGSDENT